MVRGEGAVAVMGGEDEGAFQWLTLNYLLGNLGGGIEARALRTAHLRLAGSRTPSSAADLSEVARSRAVVPMTRRTRWR